MSSDDDEIGEGMKRAHQAWKGERRPNAGPPSEFVEQQLPVDKVVQMAAAGELLELPVPGAPGRTVRGEPEHVRKYVEQIARQRVQATMWPSDNRAQMTALARLFPCFSREYEHVPGIDPWDPSELVDALNSNGYAPSVRNAALFLLCIWNREDWSDPKFCSPHLKLRRRRKGQLETVRRIGRFDLTDAWSNWDEQHRGAALAWMLSPFWP